MRIGIDSACKKKRARPKRIEINVSVYKCHVIIFFGATLKEIAAYGKKRGCLCTSSWVRNIETIMEHFDGFHTPYGEDNRDSLIWLKKCPETAIEYGTLYHEIYHAVDSIAFGIDPAESLSEGKGISEARAYLFEYLVTFVNKKLWV